jgi:hypothetical protein
MPCVACTYMPRGAVKRNEEGYRPPEGQAQRSDFSQKNYGETSCAARQGSALSEAWFPYSRAAARLI